MRLPARTAPAGLPPTITTSAESAESDMGLSSASPGFSAAPSLVRPARIAACAGSARSGRGFLFSTTNTRRGDGHAGTWTGADQQLVTAVDCADAAAAVGVAGRCSCHAGS
jgi:hypothetical protein